MSTIFTAVEVGGRTVSAGELDTTLRRGRLASMFRYRPEYISSPAAYALEPALPLVAGAQAAGAALPRSFQDAAPDRWGRNLIAKRERALAAAGSRTARSLDDRDYLLGVSDVTRQGALRFRSSVGGEFEHPMVDVPKLVRLPTLMRAADAVSYEDAPDAEVKVLLDAGSGSLGGARPKASVQGDGVLKIAKFGHPSDEWDVMRWEKTALDLAARAGITVPASTLLQVGGRAVLVLDRFDRVGAARLGYMSALTLLEEADGVTADYLDIAEALTDVSGSTSADLAELWRRMAVSIALHNTDDHLRNHGLLRHSRGWRLSPVFDVNPEPDPNVVRRTSIVGATGAGAEASALMEAAPLFGLTRERAVEVVTEVLDSVTVWDDVARHHGVVEAEISWFAPAVEAGMNALRAAR